MHFAGDNKITKGGIRWRWRLSLAEALQLSHLPVLLSAREGLILGPL